MVDKLNRRDFISATAVAGAGMLLEACKSDSGEQKDAIKKSSLNTINVALIGFGEEGKILLESLLNIEGVRLVALCDIWEYHRGEGQRYLQKLGIDVRAYENYEDLLAKEKDLQAVFIATPDFCHAPMTNTCLKAGLHVYCEKMMSNTIEGARSMPQWALAPEELSICCLSGQLQIDLGAIGKGFALDRMADLLRDWDCESFLLVAGGSSILAGDPPKDAPGWSCGLGDDNASQRLLLKHASLSGSGLTVKGEHILDPRTGRSARRKNQIGRAHV